MSITACLLESFAVLGVDVGEVVLVTDFCLRNREFIDYYSNYCLSDGVSCPYSKRSLVAKLVFDALSIFITRFGQPLVKKWEMGIGGSESSTIALSHSIAFPSGRPPLFFNVIAFFTCGFYVEHVWQTSRRRLKSNEI